MSKLLHVRSSANLEGAFSRKIGDELVSHLGPDSVVVRDLALEPLPHIGAEFVQNLHGDPNHPSLALSNRLVDELLAADTILVEASMYNFGIPSSLKAWIDHVARSGRTFSYATGKPEGLLKGKKLYLVLGRGGVYSQGPYQPMDFQEPYLISTLGFLGLTDVEVIRIEGTSMGEGKVAESLLSAREQVAHA